MPFKSTTTNYANQKPVATYPCLKVCGYKDVETRYVIMFTSPNMGVVVHSCPKAHYPVGAYSDEWAEHLFKVYLGKVILEQD